MTWRRAGKLGLKKRPPQKVPETIAWSAPKFFLHAETAIFIFALFPSKMVIGPESVVRTRWDSACD